MSIIRGAVLLVAAAILGGCRAAPEPPVETVRVVVLRRDVVAGEALTADDLVERKVPPEFVPEYTFRDASEPVGGTVIEPIAKGEVLRRERLGGIL